MSGEAVLLTDTGEGVVVIAYNRPEVMNALDSETGARLIDTMARTAARRDVHAVIFTGVGKAFCAGLDLAEGAGGVTALDLFKGSFDVAGPMQSPHQVWISAVNGAVAGAGLGFVFAADIVLAADTATFSAGFIQMGVCPDSSVSWFAAQRMGYAMALEFCLFGRKWNAERARRAGIVNRVSPANGLMELALRQANAIAALPREQVAALKTALIERERLRSPPF